MFDEAVCDCVPCVTYECAENETWNEEFCHCAPNDCTEAWAVFKYWMGVVMAEDVLECNVLDNTTEFDLQNCTCVTPIPPNNPCDLNDLAHYDIFNCSTDN